MLDVIASTARVRSTHFAHRDVETSTCRTWSTAASWVRDDGCVNTRVLVGANEGDRCVNTGTRVLANKGDRCVNTGTRGLANKGDRCVNKLVRAIGRGTNVSTLA
jgi:hypothetical protein